MATRSSNIDVRLRLQGARTFAAQLATARGELEAMGVKGTGALSSFAGQAQRLKSFGATMSRNVTLPLLGVAALGAKTAIDFSRSMAQVGVALDVPQKSLGTLNDLAIKMGAETVFSANDAAGAMLELAKGGMTDAQIQGGALESTMTLAAAGGLELADSATKVSSAMNTFGLKAKDSAKIADALAGAANASSADVSDMGLALSQVGQGAVNAGLSINETTGALAAFADNGIKGSDAGTSLKTMLQRLNPQSEKAKSLMRELGLNFFDAQGNAKSLAGITQELTQGFGGLTQEQRSAAMQTIFGSDATRAASVLFKEGADGVRKYVKATKERGAAQKMADAQMKGLPGAWESLKGSLETAALVIGNKLAPSLEVVADAIIKVVNGFTGLPGGVQTAIVAFGAAAAAVGPLSWALGGLATGAGKLVMWLPKVISFVRGFMALQAAVGMTEALTVALAGFGITLKGVMLTTGIGAVIAAVVLLNEKFHFLGPTLEFIKRIAEATFGWIKTAAGDAADWLVGAWQKIRGPIAAVWNGIKTAAKIVFAAINIWTKPMQIAVIGAFKAIKAVAGPVWTAIKTIAVTVFKVIKFQVETFVGFWKTIFGGIASVAQSVFNGVKGIVIGVLNWIIARINDVIGVMNSAIGAFNKLPGPDIGEIGTIGQIPTAAEVTEMATGGGHVGGQHSAPELRHPGAQGKAPAIPTPGATEKIGAGSGKLNRDRDTGPVIENRFYVDSAEVATKVVDKIERARARQ